MPVRSGCITPSGSYGESIDLVSTDQWRSVCNPVVNMHLVIKPEGEGFVMLSDAQGGSIQTTLNQLFAEKQKSLTQSTMFDAGDRYYVTYVQGGKDLKHSGYNMYETNCNGEPFKQDPRALPDAFVSAETSNGGGFGKFNQIVDGLQPKMDLCASDFSYRTGYRFESKE